VFDLNVIILFEYYLPALETSLQIRLQEYTDQKLGWLPIILSVGVLGPFSMPFVVGSVWLIKISIRNNMFIIN
jgi:hypothetical protein